MGLFLSVLISEGAKVHLEGLQRALEARGTGRFVPRENLHLTLAFLGETDREAAIGRAVRAVTAGREAFPITLEGLGRFGDVLWAGVRREPALLTLGEDLQRALRAEGLDLEERPFVPHVTLARRWQGDEKAAVTGTFTLRAEAVGLFSSEPAGARRIYRLRERWELRLPEESSGEGHFCR